MKIKYREYEQKTYEEITLEKLKDKLISLYKDNSNIFIVVLDEVKNGVLYFSEIDVCDYFL